MAYRFEIKHTEYRTVDIQADSMEEAQLIAEKLTERHVSDFDSWFFDMFYGDEFELCAYHCECEDDYADYKNGKWEDGILGCWVEE